MTRVADAVASLGEPWQTFVDPPELDRRLRAMGFSDVSVLAPADAAARYFAGRRYGLPPPGRSTIASAVV